MGAVEAATGLYGLAEKIGAPTALEEIGMENMTRPASELAPERSM